MATKTTPASYEEALAAAATAKENKKAARQALKEFEAEKGLKHREDHSEHEDAKVAKQWKKLNATLQKAISSEETLEKEAKEAKPKSERVSKYDYPAEIVTAEQKKKYRTEQRNAAKKALKEAEAPTKEKASKEKASKKEAEVTPTKKVKKASKKAEATSDEDED